MILAENAAASLEIIPAQRLSLRVLAFGHVQVNEIALDAERYRVIPAQMPTGTF
jgi:hypothetical protein